MKLTIKTLAATAIILTMAGCSQASPNKAELITVGYVGGMCVQGSVCESFYTFYEDGSTSEDVTVDVTELKAAIAKSKINKLGEDAEAYCPSFADGQDQTLQVPAWGDEVYMTCRVKGGADDPLATAAANAVDFIRDRASSREMLSQDF